MQGRGAVASLPAARCCDAFLSNPAQDEGLGRVFHRSVGWGRCASSVAPDGSPTGVRHQTKAGGPACRCRHPPAQQGRESGERKLTRRTRLGTDLAISPRPRHHTRQCHWVLCALRLAPVAVIMHALLTTIEPRSAFVFRSFMPRKRSHTSGGMRTFFFCGQTPSFYVFETNGGGVLWVFKKVPRHQT